MSAVATANHIVSAVLDQSSLTKTVDEIGYIVSSVGEDITFELISGSGNILYSTVENNDVTALDSEIGATFFNNSLAKRIALSGDFLVKIFKESRSLLSTSFSLLLPRRIEENKKAIKNFTMLSKVYINIFLSSYGVMKY